MASTRFPAQLMIRRLNKMREDVDFWESTYAQWAMDPVPDHRTPQYLRRSELLQIVQADLETAINHLRGLPRIS